jgi:hypothetical protein
MTTEQIAELLKLAEEATPRPWAARGNDLYPGMGKDMVRIDEARAAPGSPYVGIARVSEKYGVDVSMTRGKAEPEWANARYIVAACELLPRLLEERDALLAAAKEAAEGFDIVAADDARLLGLLRSAIAKAEAP